MCRDYRSAVLELKLVHTLQNRHFGTICIASVSRRYYVGANERSVKVVLGNSPMDRRVELTVWKPGVT